MFNAGTLTLSSAVGGDLTVSGNITDNGTFNASNRAIFFTGSSVQDIQGSGTFDIAYVRINKDGGSVRMLSNLTCAGPNGGNAMELNSETSILDLNGLQLTLGQASVASTYNSRVAAPGFIRGSNNSSIVINGTGALGTLNFETGNRSLAILTINRTSTGSVTLGTDLTVVTGLGLTDGALNIGSTTLTLNGTVARTSGTIGASIGTVTFNSGEAQSVPASLFTSNTVLNLNIPNTSGVTFNGSAAISGTMTVNGLFTPVAAAVISGVGTVTGSGTIQVTRIDGNTDLTGQYSISNRTLANLTTEYIGDGASQGVAANTTFGGLKISNANGVNMKGDVTVNGALNLNTGNLNISANTLTLNGDIIRSAGFLGGTSGSSGSTLTINGSGNPTSSLFFATAANGLKDLTINRSSGTVTLGNALRITGILTPTDGVLASGGNLTLVSTASSTARVAANTSGGTYITGDVTVERYVTGARNWHLLSIPVTGSATIRGLWAGGNAARLATADVSAQIANSGTIITGRNYTDAATANAAGFDWWPALSNRASSIRTFSNNGWPSIESNNSLLNLAPSEQGYLLFVRGDRTVTTGSGGSTTLSPKGTLKTGNQTVALTNGANSYTVVGNPYASPLSFASLVNDADNTNIINNRFWVWDANAGNFGTYRVVANINGIWNEVPFNESGNGVAFENGEIIASGQAFIVQTNTRGSLTIKETHKSSGTPGITVFGGAESANAGTIAVNLLQPSGDNLQLMDGVLAVYGADYTNTSTDGLDVAKLMNTESALSLGIASNTKLFTVEARPSAFVQDTVWLQLGGLSNSTFTLQVKNDLNLATGTTVQLVDRFTSNTITIANNTVGQLTFTGGTITASLSPNRFILVISQPATLPVRFLSAKAYRNAGSNHEVHWTMAAEDNIQLYEVQRSTNGRTFNKVGEITIPTAGSKNYQWSDAFTTKAATFYRIAAIAKNGSKLYSAVLQIAGSISQQLPLQVYPNPVKGTQLTLVLGDQPAGTVQVRLVNAVGQTLFTRLINHSGGSASQTIDTGKQPGGWYEMQLIRNGELLATSKIQILGQE